MIDQEIEAAYEAALKEFNNGRWTAKSSISRYFFFAGAQFGVETTRKLYLDTYEKEVVDAQR